MVGHLAVLPSHHFFSVTNGSSNISTLDTLSPSGIEISLLYSEAVLVILLNICVFALAQYGDCVNKNSDLVYFLCLSISDCLSGVLLFVTTILTHLHSLNFIPPNTSCMFLIPLLEICVFYSGIILTTISIVQLHSIWKPVDHMRYKTATFSIVVCSLLWIFSLITTFVAEKTHLFQCKLETLFDEFFLIQRDLKSVTVWMLLLVIATLNLISFVKSVLDAPLSTNPRNARASLSPPGQINTRVFSRISRIGARVAPILIGRTSVSESKWEYEPSPTPNSKKQFTFQKFRDRSGDAYIVPGQESIRPPNHMVKFAWEMNEMRGKHRSRTSDCHAIAEIWPQQSLTFLNKIENTEDSGNPAQHSNVGAANVTVQTNTEVIFTAKTNNVLIVNAGPSSNNATNSKRKSESKDRSRLQSSTVQSAEISAGDSHGARRMTAPEDGAPEISRLSQTKNRGINRISTQSDIVNSQINYNTRSSGTRFCNRRPIKGILTIMLFWTVYALCSVPYFLYVTFDISNPGMANFTERENDNITVALVIIMFMKSFIDPILIVMKLRMFHDTLQKVRRRLPTACRGGNWSSWGGLVLSAAIHLQLNRTSRTHSK